MLKHEDTVTLKRIGSLEKMTAVCYCLFLGWLGIHHFYLGETWKGIIYILISWTGLPLIFSIFELIYLLTLPDLKFDLKYNYGD